MDFRIARAANKTGSLLQRLVAQELGDSAEGVVCYGVGYKGPLPTLNANCSSLNKLEQARALRNVLGAQALNPLTLSETLHFMESYREKTGALGAFLGRTVKHAKGKDIRLCLEPWQVQALEGVSDFFTPYWSSIAEYRVWVYRKRHLGTYKKVLKEAGAMRRVGRNYDNGFRFERIERTDVPEELKEVSRKAVSAVGLDFGAVDVLENTPGKFVVLEVNSAPGVQDERRAVINKLAHRVVRWAQEGFPERSSDATA